MKLALSVQYLGKNYYGFQKQKKNNTVQEEIEKTLFTILREHIHITVCGRTDVTVNAYAQVFHFEVSQLKVTVEEFIYSCNCILPQDISIIYGKIVEDNFHARFSCLAREYVYCIYHAKYRSSIFNNYLWVRQKLDISLMKQATSYIMGEKDFASFTKIQSAKTLISTTRVLHQLEVVDQEPFLYFYFMGSGFLHNMVRIISGLLLDVGSLKVELNSLPKLIQSKNR